jgi:hypothetical protein
MNAKPDAAYALERETQERLAADAALHPAARRIHLKMAKSYADRADAAEGACSPPIVKAAPAVPVPRAGPVRTAF